MKPGELVGLHLFKDLSRWRRCHNVENTVLNPPCPSDQSPAGPSRENLNINGQRVYPRTYQRVVFFHSTFLVAKQFCRLCLRISSSGWISFLWGSLQLRSGAGMNCEGVGVRECEINITQTFQRFFCAPLQAANAYPNWRPGTRAARKGEFQYNVLHTFWTFQSSSFWGSVIQKSKTKRELCWKVQVHI